MHTRFEHPISFETAGSAREIGLENTMVSDEYHVEYSRMVKHLPLHSLYASSYLRCAESYLSRLIPTDNLKEIFTVARYFPGNLTSFLGFECRLGEPEARADWAFAISGAGDDRQVLINLLKHKYVPEGFLEQPEWLHIIDFAASWGDPKSILRDKVKCFWLEFDMPNTMPEVPIPSVFFGPTSLPEGVSPNDVSQYNWLISTALPLLTGQSLSKVVEQRLKKCIRQMPQNTSLFQVGTMLSRSTNSIRLYITRLKLEQIIPYLNAIGWSYTAQEFTALIDDLKDKADRFVLSFDVTKEGIGPRVGIECSFTSDEFQKETRWNQLLDYLVEKRLCLPEKRDALLSYSGAETSESGGAMKPLTSASRDLEDILSSTIIRYISHIKIVFQPGHPLEAKAYPAVRLFGSPKASSHEESLMITEGGT